MGYIFHASPNVNYDSIDAHGLVLSPYSHGIGHEKGRVGVHFVYAGGVTQPRHGTVIRKGRDIHYWNLNYWKFLQDGFQLRGTPNGVVLAMSDVPRVYLEPLYTTPPEHFRNQIPREPPMPPPPTRVRPPNSSTDEIDGVLRTPDENAKEFTRFLSSVNMVTCNPWYLWEKGFAKLWIQGRDGSRVEARGDYDEPRVHLMEYDSLPDGIRNRLDVADKLEWMCHPLSGYLIKVFLDAFELGSVWGSIVLERIIKPNAGY